MTSWQVSNAIYSDGNFHEDFKNLIGFVLAIWEGSKPTPYFEGTEFGFFKGERLV